MTRETARMMQKDGIYSNRSATTAPIGKKRLATIEMVRKKKIMPALMILSLIKIANNAINKGMDT